MLGFFSRAQRGLGFQVAYNRYAGKPAHGRTASIRHPVCFEAADARPIHCFVRQPAGWLRVPYAGKPRGGMPPHEGGKSMMPVCLAVELVNPAAIRAFDAAVGGNR